MTIANANCMKTEDDSIGCPLCSLVSIEIPICPECHDKYAVCYAQCTQKRGVVPDQPWEYSDDYIYLDLEDAECWASIDPTTPGKL